jgi:hypothetical protein
MIALLVLLAASVGTYLAGRRSLWMGLGMLFGVGYVYGIWRANEPGLAAYLLFDAAVLGLYASQAFAVIPALERSRMQHLRFWVTLLIGWPVLLFALYALAPDNHPLVELVGLRANVFLLPFLLLGARLTSEDLERLGLTLACLNLGAVAFGLLQFFYGIEMFFPRNEVTEIIYKSRDLVGWTSYRIPSSFSSAHAFAGTLVMTIPLVFGAWVRPHQRPWAKHLLSAALVASLFGVFMAAARQHMLLACVLGAVLTFTRELGGQRLRWLVGVALVAYLVAGDARLQRFTTLRDTEAVSSRVQGSVNDDLLELMNRYPLGNGLAGGGTSIPHFLRDQAKPSVGLENEYARIMLEQGLPGLALWMAFVAWFLTGLPRRRVAWSSARRLAWVACVASFAAGLIGTGMLTSVPQTTLMLLLAGWVSVAPRFEIAAQQTPRRVPHPTPAPLPTRGRDVEGPLAS